MSKLCQIIFTGILFTFILDYFLFLGVKINYIDFHEIDIYYNILFSDNQNAIIFATLSIMFGLVIIYLPNRVAITLTLLSFLAVSSTLISDIGYKTGEYMFMQKSRTFSNKKHTFIGDIYYIGREKIRFYDYEIKKVIDIKRNNDIVPKI